MTNKQLTDHFWLNELLVSSTADQRGIANTPTDEHLKHLEQVLAPGLEKVRAICGNRPVTVTSAYRNPKINDLVGGTKTSAHPMGYAADFRVSGLSAFKTASIVAAAMDAGDLKVDQLILESGRSIVHVSFDPRSRMQKGHQPGGPGTKIDWNFFN